MSGAPARVAVADAWAHAGPDGNTSTHASSTQPNERLIMMGRSYVGMAPGGKDPRTQICRRPELQCRALREIRSV